MGVWSDNSIAEKLLAWRDALDRNEPVVAIVHSANMRSAYQDATQLSTSHNTIINRVSPRALSARPRAPGGLC